MKKIASLLVLMASSFIQTLPANELHYDASISAGLRRDTLKWHIAGPNRIPNVLSELKFKHVKMRPYTLALKAYNDDYYVHAYGSYGEISSGTMRDSDYLRMDRRYEFSRSYSKITGGYMSEGAILAGARFHMNKDATGSLLAGYSILQEHMRFKHGVQKIGIDMFSGVIEKVNYKIHDLSSTYTSRWDGPFIGGNCKYHLTKSFSIHGEYRLLFCQKYRGRGFWNLRQKQHKGAFHQRSRREKGFGNQISVGAAYKLADGLDVFIDGTYMALRARDGHDSVRARREHRTVRIPFGKASLDSTSGRFGFRYSF